MNNAYSSVSLKRNNIHFRLIKLANLTYGGSEGIIWVMTGVLMGQKNQTVTTLSTKGRKKRKKFITHQKKTQVFVKMTTL